MSESSSDPVHGTDSRNEAAAGGPAPATLTPLAQQYLDQTRPWVRFMSIMTFISAGLMALVGLLTLAMTTAWRAGRLAPPGYGEFGGFASLLGGGVATLVYLVLACIYIAPAVFLSRYASAIHRLKANSTSGGLEDALKHQKSFWRFVGVLTLIGIVVGVIVVGLAIIVGAMIAVPLMRQ